LGSETGRVNGWKGDVQLRIAEPGTAWALILAIGIALWIDLLPVKAIVVAMKLRTTAAAIGP
jgi:hypothetical protein